MIRWLVVAILVGACGADAPSLQIIVDTPAEGSDAFPYEGLDTLVLSVARSGDDLAIQEVSSAADESPSLSNLAFETDLVVHLSGRADDVEAAYGRSCSFDVVDGAAAGREPRLYFSRILRWGQAPEPRAPTRTSGAAYALPDGRAVFLGGGADVERFDPLDTGRFEPVNANEQPTERLGAAVAPLSDGRAVIIGGVNGSTLVSVLEVLDPRPVAGPRGRIDAQSIGLAVSGHRATTLVDGTVLVAGGTFQDSIGDTPALTAQAWLLSFGEEGLLDPPNELLATLGTAREEFSMTRLGSDIGAAVLIAGGRDVDGNPLASAELYRPLDEAFEPANGTLVVPRFGHTAVPLVGGLVLIIGGFTVDMGQVVPADALEVFDPIQGQFAQVGDLPTGAGVTEFAVAPLPDGRILITGGRDAGGEPVAAAFIARRDSRSGAIDFLGTDPLLAPRAGHSAVSLCDGTILVVGGTDDPQAGAERYNPSSADRR